MKSKLKYSNLGGKYAGHRMFFNLFRWLRTPDNTPTLLTHQPLPKYLNALANKYGRDGFKSQLVNDKGEVVFETTHLIE